jgi:hypothetical protein
MKPPNKNGDPVAEAAVLCVKPSENHNARCQFASVKAPDLEDITIEESRDLVRLEKVIEGGLQTFMEVGAALAEIRDRRLYRIEHKTFEAYCRDKWSIGRTYAHRLMASNDTVEMLPVGNKPTSERQVRPLTKLPKEKRAEAWQRAVEASPSGQPTAADVEAVVEEVKQPAQKRPPRAARIDGFYRVTLNIEMEKVLSVEPVESGDASTITLVVCSESQARHLLKGIRPAKLSRLMWQAARRAQP